MARNFLDDADVAICFLEGNEGDDEERGACLAIAEFLRKEWHRRDRASNTRVAKRFGTTPERVAEVIAKDRKERGVRTS